jgi:hypothetical protein
MTATVKNWGGKQAAVQGCRGLRGAGHVPPIGAMLTRGAAEPSALCPGGRHGRQGQKGSAQAQARCLRHGRALVGGVDSKLDPGMEARWIPASPGSSVESSRKAQVMQQLRLDSGWSALDQQLSRSAGWIPMGWIPKNFRLSLARWRAQPPGIGFGAGRTRTMCSGEVQWSAVALFRTQLWALGKP